MTPAFFTRLKRHPSPWVRRAAGVLLVIGGVLGFLPVLGFWMLPLGLVLLSDDVPWLRRRRRAAQVWVTRRWSFNGNRRGR
ncbi:MAG: hypothetical protein IH906_06050 [Proteobacteria bacterium]|nr:hypothetical protein [Pseudomonadota bacterium]